MERRQRAGARRPSNYRQPKFASASQVENPSLRIAVVREALRGASLSARRQTETRIAGQTKLVAVPQERTVGPAVHGHIAVAGVAGLVRIRQKPEARGNARAVGDAGEAIHECRRPGIPGLRQGAAELVVRPPEAVVGHARIEEHGCDSDLALVEEGRRRTCRRLGQAASGPEAGFPSGVACWSSRILRYGQPLS